MSSPKTRAKGSSSSRSPAYLTRDGVDQHAIEVRSKLHSFTEKIWMKTFSTFLRIHSFWVLTGLVWCQRRWSICSRRMLKLPFASKALLPWLLTPWLLSRYADHWKRAGIYDSIFLSKQSVNIDENLLAAALCFWNSASWKACRCLVLLEYMHLAEALHNHTDVGLGPTVLAHL
ncbi:unnamed protein product [Prunus brigantina]